MKTRLLYFKKTLIGLDRYFLDFTNKKNMDKWISLNKHTYQIEEVFVNNGYRLEIKKLRVY